MSNLGVISLAHFELPLGQIIYFREEKCYRKSLHFVFIFCLNVVSLDKVPLKNARAMTRFTSEGILFSSSFGKWQETVWLCFLIPDNNEIHTSQSLWLVRE